MFNGVRLIVGPEVEIVPPGIAINRLPRGKTGIPVEPVGGEQIQVLALLVIVVEGLGLHMPDQQTGGRLAAVVVMGFPVAVL